MRFIGLGNGVLQSLYDRSVGFFRRQIILSIPDVAAMETQMKKYEKFFKTSDGKQKALEKKNADLSAALEKSEQQSTHKKIQEARLQSDYERAKAILDRIPPEIIRALRIVTAKRRRYAIIDNRKKDEWNGFADLLANLIEKYAAVVDIENLPEPSICLDSKKKEIVNKSKLFAESIEKTDIE